MHAVFQDASLVANELLSSDGDSNVEDVLVCPDRRSTVLMT